MRLRDYPVGQDGLWIPGNVEIVVRERGKRVLQHCRHDHNIWVNLGREYLARVVAPNTALDDHFAEPPPEYIKYMGVGIGGESQTHPAAYSSPLKDDYPPADAGGAPGGAGNQFSDADLTVTYLERPVMVSSTSPIWLAPVITPVTFLNDSKTVRFDHVFDVTDVNLAAMTPYSVVPLSEVGLFLATQDPDASNVYDTGNPNDVGAGRQTIVAYNTFEAIPKTVSFSLEIRWELRF